MKLHSDTRADQHRITAYGHGYVTVNRKKLTQSLVVSPSALITSWPPQMYRDLAADHFEVVADLHPEVVVIGTGSRQHFPASTMFTALEKRSIGIEIMDTGAACRTYNILMSEGRAIAAALLMVRE